ncbi:hypothetical protein OG21DRAFT_1563804 [Imleria badia]|nr:hypothetical protein OG21DRAFT_1563804 [Imleria badia]
MNQPPTTPGATPTVLSTPQTVPVQPAQPPTQSGSVTTIAPTSSLSSIPTTTPSSTIASHPFYVQSAVIPLQKHEKLHEDNWNGWKKRITGILDSKGVLDVVLGETPRPPGPDTDLDVAFWIRRSCNAKAQIIVSLTDNQLMNIESGATAPQTWEALRTIHEPAHILLRQYSIGDLWAIHTTEDTDITDHITNLTNIHHTLIRNQQHVSDSDFKNILLDSVPRSW